MHKSALAWQESPNYKIAPQAPCFEGSGGLKPSDAMSYFCASKKNKTAVSDFLNLLGCFEPSSVETTFIADV